MFGSSRQALFSAGRAPRYPAARQLLRAFPATMVVERLEHHALMSRCQPAATSIRSSLNRETIGRSGVVPLSPTPSPRGLGVPAIRTFGLARNPPVQRLGLLRGLPLKIFWRQRIEPHLNRARVLGMSGQHRRRRSLAPFQGQILPQRRAHSYPPCPRGKGGHHARTPTGCPLRSAAP
jgi:hypothetical protein